MKSFEVVAAILIKEDESGQKKIFCARRPGPKPGQKPNETNFKWEFPGGKIEEGENQQEALKREIKEELGAEISVDDYMCTVFHQYKDFSITMYAWICHILSGSLELKEHIESDWITVNHLKEKDWAAADKPIVSKIQSFFR